MVDQMQDIDGVIKTEMIIKRIKSNELVQTILELFNEDLIAFQHNPVKERLLISSQFLTAHNGGFECLAVSRNGQLMITGSGDTTVRVWELNEKKQLACYSDHKGAVKCVVISKNCSLALSGSDDKTLILWDIKKHSLKNIFYGSSGSVNSVAFTFDEAMIVSGSYSKEISIWSVQNFKLIKKISTFRGVYCLISISPQEFVSATYKNLEKWDLINLQKTNSIKAHDSAIWSVAKTNNSQFLITGSGDHLVKVWETLSLKIFAVLNGHTERVVSVCATADDSQIVSGSEDRSIILWRILSKTIVHRFTYHSDHVYGVMSMNDLIFSVSRDSRIGITKLSTKTFESFISLTPFYVASESFKGDSVAVGSMNKVLVWHSSQPEIILEGHRGMVLSCCFCNEKDLLISGSKGSENNLILWNLKQMRMISVLKGHENSVGCVDISVDGLNAISGDYSSKVRYWNLHSYKQECLFEWHTGQVYSVKITNNKRFAASGGEDKKVQYAVLFGHNHKIWKISFTNDDDSIVSGDYVEGISVWSIEYKKKMFSFKTFEVAKEWLCFNRDMQVEFRKFIF